MSGKEEARRIRRLVRLEGENKPKTGNLRQTTGYELSKSKLYFKNRSF
jgi:hypothetical protein